MSCQVLAVVVIVNSLTLTHYQQYQRTLAQI